MNAEENNLIPAENTPAKAPQKKDIVQSAKDFLGNTFGGKSQDLTAVIEQFTSEMTLVAEGLSEDQIRLSQQADQMSAQQTTFEAETQSKFAAQKAETDALKKQVKSLEDKLSKTEKLLAEKKKKSEGVQGILRQASILAGIIAGAWILTTLINFFK